ncbi:hypothetical protein HAX54_052156 [Datura stramonium]|uniref:Uncharacterized protein n=1 Tax=Datura stramonium TaxID=4076 RepID=A0ABS8T0P6_DATST|nr:hypothetical protein [Datura stramonium]
MREIYVAGLATTAGGTIKRGIFEEVQIRSSDLIELLEIKDLFDHYKLGWMSESSGKYSLTMIREFHIAATLIKMRKKGKLAWLCRDARWPILPIVDQIVQDSHIQDICKDNTTAIPSSAPTTAVRPPTAVLAFVFTQKNLASLARRTEKNEKQIDLLAQQLKPFVAKSIAATVSPIHKAASTVPLFDMPVALVSEDPHDERLAPESTEHSGDQGPEGESQIVIGASRTTGAVTMEVVPTTPTSISRTDA